MAKKGRPPTLTKEQAQEIQELYRTTRLNLTQLARLFRVSPGTIARAIEGKYA
jgi:transposase